MTSYIKDTKITFVLLFIFFTTLITQGISENHSSEIVIKSFPMLESRIRLTIVYFQCELYWVFTGKYPKSLQELIYMKEDVPVGPLDAEMITDPYSKFGLPLRYRVTKNGPELISIGPDRRWGGWEYDNFYSLDDIRINRANAIQMIKGYLHATYGEFVEKGIIKFPNVHIRSYTREGGFRKLLEDFGKRETKSMAKAMNPQEFLLKLRENDEITIYDNRIENEYLTPAKTGINSWSPSGPDLRELSLYKAFCILKESTCEYIELVVFDSSAIIDIDLEISEEGRAFWQLSNLPIYSNSFSRLGPQNGMNIPDKMMVILPDKWFDENSLKKFKEVIDRLFAGEKEKKHVYITTSGIAVTHFGGSWSHIFFIVDRFPESVPKVKTYYKIRGEIFKSKQE